MKQKTFLFVAIFLSTGALAYGQSTQLQTNFDWLLGGWVRVNSKPGQQTFEHWEKTNADLYNGIGYTLEAADTVWKETMTLQKTAKGWRFVVVQKGSDDKVPFSVTEMNKGKFVCVNNNNPFPKVIAYKLEGDILYARISDDTSGIDFVFKRVEQ